MADILVIDDDEMMVEIISELLSDEGHSVRSAADGQAGLDEVARQWPDLILLDMNMPVIDGYAVATSVRRRPAGQSISIIAVTGDSTAAARRAVYEAGCDAMVVKPIDVDDLITQVADFLR